MNSLRDRILDAAFELTVENGWSDVTMAAVGTAAGVSRQSVYNEFGNKPTLAAALIGREVERFLVAVNAELAAGTTPADAAERAVRIVFLMAADNPLLHSVLSNAGGASSDLLPLLTSQAQPVIDVAVAQVETSLREKFADLPDDLTSLVDSLVRVVLSHLVRPGRADADDVAVLVRRVL